MSELATDRDNYCYRHADRQSFVLCQRCGRTICGECQTQAPVGVICPECMREQRAETSRMRPAAYTAVASAARSDAPVATYAIIAVTAIVYVLQWVPALGLTRAWEFAGIYLSAQAFEPWRALTAVFLHSTGSIFHILLNMYTLWVFGRLLEPMLGRGRYLTLYLISGLAGSVGVAVLDDPLQGVLGASGAIFGLMGAFVVISRRLGANLTQLYILLAINLAFGFFVPGIAWQAHVGGLVGGVLCGLVYLETRQRSRFATQVALLVGLSVLLFGLGVLVANWRAGGVPLY